MRRRRYRKQSIQKKESNDQFLKPTVQTKLNMGQPGDKYEVEADNMADQVVNNNKGDGAIQKKDTSTGSVQEEEVQQKPLASGITPFVQKMGASEEENGQAKLQRKEEEEPVQQKEEEEVQKKGEEEEVQAKEEEEVQKKGEEEEVQAKEDEEVQAKCAECESEGVQKKGDTSAGSATEEEVQAKANGAQQRGNFVEGKLRNGSGGKKMDDKTQSEMESGFGADFGNVRIHNDAEAQEMSQELGAQAFTHGNDIYFNSGKYDPSTKEGKHLLAHELTHTIQQKGMVQKKVQKRPSYTGARIRHDIDPLDPSTAPAGNPTGLGHTDFYVNSRNFKDFVNSDPEAAKNVLFPLPETTKDWGTCVITNRDITLKAYSIVRILTVSPWEKTMSKAEAKAILGGALRNHITDAMPENIKVVVRGQNGDLTLRANDLLAEMQHANDDYCLFTKHLMKYQNDLDAMADEFSAGYGGMGSCDARLEEQLNRDERLRALVSDYVSFTGDYDDPGHSHYASLSVSTSSDNSTVFADFAFGALPTQNREC